METALHSLNNSQYRITNIYVRSFECHYRGQKISGGIAVDLDVVERECKIHKERKFKELIPEHRRFEKYLNELIPKYTYLAYMYQPIKGRDYNWRNGILSQSVTVTTSEEYCIASSRHARGGDIGISVSDKFVGKQIAIRCKYKILRGKGKLGFDHYKVGIVVDTEYWHEHTQTSLIELRFPDEARGKGKAVIRLEPDSEVRIDWFRVELS